MNHQIKSKERVASYGEVFTNEREVKNMCNLVPQECLRIDSKILEPACGNGNFLVEILKRKLITVEKLYKRSIFDFERYSLLSICCLYGVDILQDNVEECKKRLFDIWDKKYSDLFKKDCSIEMRRAIDYVLDRNILCGNALTLMRVDTNCKDLGVPIIFPEWSLIGNKIKRRDFRLDVLLRAKDSSSDGDAPLLEDELNLYLKKNPKTEEYFPLPVKEYSPVFYKNIINLN